MAAVFSARRIECEFDERDELMQRLIFGKLAGRLARIMHHAERFHTFDWRPA